MSHCKLVVLMPRSTPMVGKASWIAWTCMICSGGWVPIQRRAISTVQGAETDVEHHGEGHGEYEQELARGTQSRPFLHHVICV